MCLTKLHLTTRNKYVVAAFIALISLAVLWRYRDRPSYVFVPNDISVTIPEGSNLAEIDRLISEAGIAPQGALLAPTFLNDEGMFFPDTYRFDRGSAADDIRARFEKNFISRLREVGIAADKKTLIIASMLEKEVRTEDDMRTVAGIIRKRLDAGMALQIDASVAYGACYPKFLAGQYCNVAHVNLVDNIKRDSAYNTYMRTGLPPGPISNAGLAAIRAASDPLESQYWYYLNARDGTTVFSKTLEEHNRARAKYLR